ncbi:MAG TPA: hypothetical protein VFX70_18425 [Mycobacteriales bacterium]|nr:hypothetical protein [Mycobacteriales bacterium]
MSSAVVPQPPCDAYERALAAVYARLDGMLSCPVLSGRWEDSNPPETPA